MSVHESRPVITQIQLPKTEFSTSLDHLHQFYIPTGEGMLSVIPESDSCLDRIVVGSRGIVIIDGMEWLGDDQETIEALAAAAQTALESQVIDPGEFEASLISALRINNLAGSAVYALIYMTDQETVRVTTCGDPLVLIHEFATNSWVKNTPQSHHKGATTNWVSDDFQSPVVSVTNEVGLNPRDAILAFTDGFWKLFGAEEITQILDDDPSGNFETLVHEAIKRNKTAERPDDMSALLYSHSG